jgi:hypothetical protein
VHLLVLAQPVDVGLARQRGVVEGALLHELLPVGRGAHLLEQVDVEGDLVGVTPGVMKMPRSIR